MALPPNWAKYTTDDGKEYYHNAVTDKTQWEKPEWPTLAPESLSFHSSTSEVYQYKPTVSDLELHERISDAEGRLVGMEPRSLAVEAAGKAPGGKVPTSDHETVSLNNTGGSLPSPAGSFGAFGGSLVGGVLAAASSEDGAAMSGMAGSLLAYAQQFFDVSSDDVIKRLRLALIPYPPPAEGSSVSDFRAHPDFWGPFWIATTAVLFLAATGNFARLLETDKNSVFKADYSLVSLAAAMIYGCLVGVPVVTRVALYLAGHEADSINFRQMICVYGYSLAPAIPVSILCLVPFGAFRWLAVFLGLAGSLLFIRNNLWTDLAIEAPSLKWKMVGLLVVAQAAIFFIYRVHFFSGVP